MHQTFPEDEQNATDPYQARPWLAFYAAEVPKDVAIPDIPVFALLDEAAARHPRRAALAFFGRSLDYEQLRNDSVAFADALRGLGVGPGDRVALVLPNCPQGVIAFFAALRLGAIVVSCNPLYTSDELNHQLRDCGAEVVVALDRVYGTLVEALPGTHVQRIVTTSLADYLPPLKRRLLDFPTKHARELRERLIVPLPDGADTLDFARLLAGGERRPAWQSPVINPVHDLAVLQYTGGTTGRPKGAMLTHRNLVANAYQVRAWEPRAVDGQETFIAVLPLFHVYGLSLCIMTGVLLAATIVLLPTFEVDLVLSAIRRHRPTVIPGVPPIYSRLLESPKIGKYDLRSIRDCISGAMRLPPETVTAFQAVTGGLLVEGYGMTESSPVTVANPLSRNARAGTVGLPVPSTYIRIVDEWDSEAIKPIGEAGELLVHGPQVFSGYWNSPEETATTLTGGWLHTGDVAVMSPDGFLTLIDRKRDVVMTDGYSVYPSEVEDVLRGHPAIKDAAVIGVPDPRRGEAVKAYIQPGEGVSITAEEVIRFAAEHLAPYKVPKLVEMRDEMPRNMIGKVLRRVLRTEHAERFGLPDGPSDPFEEFR
jgi:long-chain acyl-CoA synthetase